MSDPLQLAAWAYEYPDYISSPINNGAPAAVPRRAYCRGCGGFGTLKPVELNNVKLFVCRSCDNTYTSATYRKPIGFKAVETRSHSHCGIESKGDPFLISRIRGAVESTENAAQKFFFFAHTSMYGKLEACEISFVITRFLINAMPRTLINNINADKAARVLEVFRALILSTHPCYPKIRTTELASIADINPSQFRGLKYWARLRHAIRAIVFDWEFEVITAVEKCLD